MLKYTIGIGVAVFTVCVTIGLWLFLPNPVDDAKIISYADLPFQTIDTIRIEGPMAATLTREHEQWQLQDGRRADKDVIQLFFHQMQQLRSDDAITSDSARYHDLGVDSAQGHKITFLAGRKSLASLIVGKTFGYNLVIRVGNKVWRCLMSSNTPLIRHPSQWQDRTLLQTPVHQIVSMTVTLTNQTPYQLKRTDSTFELNPSQSIPEGFRFSPARAQQMVGYLSQLRAMELLYPDPGQSTHQLTATADKIEWTVAQDPNLQGSQPIQHTLWLGAAKDNHSVYASLQGRAEPFTLPSYVAQSLRAKLQDFQDLNLLRVANLHRIEKIHIQQGNKKRIISKVNNTTWQVHADSTPMPAQQQLDSMKIFRYLSSIQSARAKAQAENQTLAQKGFLPPQAVITVYEQDNPQQKITIGANPGPTAQQFYALGSQDNLLYVIDQAQLNQWLVDWSAWQAEPISDKLAGEQPNRQDGLP